MEPDGALFRAKFDGRTPLSAATWDRADRAPAGRVAAGGGPAAGGGRRWRGAVELRGGAVVEGLFGGLGPDGPATLVEGGAA